MTLIKSISIPSTPRSKNYPQGAIIYKSQGGSVGTIMSSDPDKLDKSIFDTIFEIIRIGAQLKLRVKGDLCADGGVSALGVGDYQTAGATGLDYEALQALLTDYANAYEINKAFLTAINYSYINELISSVYATQAFVVERINALINGAPIARDTLKEISDILDANINSIGDITAAISTKWTQDNAKILNWDNAATIANALAAWVKSPTKPSYSYGEITGRPTTFEEAGIEGGTLTDVLYGVDAEFSSTIKAKGFSTGTWVPMEDANGDLVFYKNGVAIAKLTSNGFVSLKGVTALGV